MHLFRNVIVFLFVVGMLAACGDEEVETEEEVDETTEEEVDGGSDEEEASEEETTEESATGPEGEMRYGFNAQPPTLDVHFTTATATRDIGRQIFESLVTFNSNYEVEPMLADDFEISEDGSVVTFHLREGILFHNGDEMTADDVLVSMEKWQEESAQAGSFLGDVTYEVEDDYTFVANIGDPTTLDMFIFADLSQMAAIMPEEVVNDAGADGVTEYIGTGPFQFEEWAQDQYIHLSAFEDYQPRSEEADGLAGEKIAQFQDLYFDIVTDASTRVSGIQSGEYDVINFVPHDNAEMLDSDPNIENLLYLEDFAGMVFNNREGFFTDETARQAVNAALNPEDMLMAAYGSEEYFSRAHELMLEDTDWYTDAGQDIYDTYDPELAEELLEEAGYDGETITLLASRDYMHYYNFAVVVQQQLENVGMNVELDVFDWGTVLDLRDDPSEYDAFFSGWAIRPTPVQYPFLESSAEWPGWTDSEEIDNAIDNIRYADSIEDAYGLAEDLQQAFWEYLPIYRPGNSYDILSHRTNVEGLQTQAGPILWNVTIDE